MTKDQIKEIEYYAKALFMTTLAYTILGCQSFDYTLSVIARHFKLTCNV